MVTGVLPVALMEATKVLQALLLSGKEYVGVMKLHRDVSEERLRRVMEEFQGEIYQRPPLRASVKRRLRIRKIYWLRLLEMDRRYVLVRVACEAGTYIRKLCADIGEALGTGAHMQELRRTRSGPFTEDENLVRLQDLSDAVYEWKEEGKEEPLRRLIFPMEKALSLLPRIVIRDSAVDAICHGAQLAAPGVLMLDEGIRQGDRVAVFTLKGEAVALSTALVSSEEMLKMRRGLVAKTERVLMKPGTYPKMWK